MLTLEDVLWNYKSPLFAAGWLFVFYFLEVGHNGVVKGFLHSLSVCVLAATVISQNLAAADAAITPANNALLYQYSFVYMIMDCVCMYLDRCDNLGLYIAHHIGVLIIIATFIYTHDEELVFFYPIFVIIAEVTNTLQQPWVYFKDVGMTHAEEALFAVFVPFYASVRLVVLPVALAVLGYHNAIFTQVDTTVIVVVGMLFVPISYDWLKKEMAASREKKKKN